MMMSECFTLFRHGQFTLHSGSQSAFKIDCDALTPDDIEALSKVISERLSYEIAYPVHAHSHQHLGYVDRF